MTLLLQFQDDEASRRRHKLLYVGFMLSPKHREPGNIQKMEREVELITKLQSVAMEGKPLAEYGGVTSWILKPGDSHAIELSQTDVEMLVEYCLAVSWGSEQKKDAIDMIHFVKSAKES